MINYMRAEFYKAFHRRYLYLFLIVMVALEALLVAGWCYTNANGNRVDFTVGASMLVALLSVGLYSVILTGDIVFSDQYKSNTLKNEVSYGIPRAWIYLGKLIVECVVAFILCAAVIIAYLGMCYLFLPHTANDLEVLGTVGACILNALPLWLGGQALINMLFFTLKSSTVGSFIAVGIFVGAGQIMRLLGALVHPVFKGVYNVLLTMPFDIGPEMLGNLGNAGLMWGVGGGWFLLTTAIGLLVFRRKEIN